MDIVNWLYLKKAELIRETIDSPDDLVLLGADVSFEKRGDKYLTYAVPVSLLTGGTSITLKTNGVNNVVQNILNLVEGSNITLTDNGDGSVTIDSTGGTGGVTSIIAGTNVSITSTGPGGTGNVTINGDGYNGDQGVYKDTSTTPDTFMLGAPVGLGNTIPFQEDREIDRGTYTLYTTSSAGSGIYMSSMTNLSGGSGIYVETNEYSIEGYSADGVGVAGSGFNAGSYGVSAYNKNGIAINSYCVNNYALDALADNFVAAAFRRQPGTPTAVISDIIELVSSTNATAGSGLVTISSGVEASRLLTKWTTGTDVSQFEIQTKPTGGSLTTNLTLKGSGQLQFNQYGAGTFNTAPLYNLGVDGSGNVVEYTIPASGVTIMVSTPETFNVDSTWNDIVPLNFAISPGKSYSFKAVISYSILDETDGGTIWAAFDTFPGAYASSSYYCQVWDGSGLVTYPSNEVGLLPPTSSISSTTYNNRSNIAIVEGVISNVSVAGNIQIKGLGKSGGLGGNTVTYLEGSSLTVYELP